MSRRRGGSTIPLFWGGITVECRLKTKIKSLSLLILFFLGPLILFSKTPRHPPQPTPSAEAPGGGVAQNINAVSLDWRPAPVLFFVGWLLFRIEVFCCVAYVCSIKYSSQMVCAPASLKLP